MKVPPMMNMTTFIESLGDPLHTMKFDARSLNISTANGTTYHETHHMMGGRNLAALIGISVAGILLGLLLLGGLAWLIYRCVKRRNRKRATTHVAAAPQTSTHYAAPPHTSTHAAAAPQTSTTTQAPGAPHTVAATPAASAPQTTTAPAPASVHQVV